MDLTLKDEQHELVNLAADILGEAAVRETSSDELWQSLARAGLLGVAVPEQFGGLGLGFAEVGLLLEQVGRTASTVPVLASLGLAAMAIRDLGSLDQQRAVLAPLAAGDIVLTAALTERSGHPLAPMVCAAGDPGRWVLRGAKDCVPAAPQATHFLVSVHLAGVGPRLLLLPADRDGVNVDAQSALGAQDGQLTFDGVRVGADDLVGALDDNRAVPRAVRYATAAACAVMSGALSRVVDLTAHYTSTREQFGRPIGSFQAVGQRAADAFTAAWSVELTARQACWCLADGQDADREVAVAKYMAASAGPQVIRAAHHLHGGIGLDRDYPLHRYTLLTKRLELLLGAASEQTGLLGDVLANEAIRAVLAGADAR
jgi:alkylation response protein AidB-like acyl-CoA dehydrogenase